MLLHCLLVWEGRWAMLSQICIGFTGQDWGSRGLQGSHARASQGQLAQLSPSARLVAPLWQPHSSLYSKERIHAGAVVEEVQPLGGSSQSWGAAETKCQGLTATFLPQPLPPLRGKGEVEESGAKLSLERRVGLVLSLFLTILLLPF